MYTTFLIAMFLNPPISLMLLAESGMKIGESVRTRKVMFCFLTLTYETPKLPSYRNLSIDWLCKSINWVLYDGSFGV